jgi:flavin reductase (DIM6/NTAB) family NADH-FMN oxidoreductase RutF
MQHPNFAVAKRAQLFHKQRTRHLIRRDRLRAEPLQAARICTKQRPGAARNSELRMSGSLASLFKSLTTGVYVVGVAHGEARDAFTAAFVMQVSFDPLLLALSINPHHSSYGLLKQGGVFSVNVLTKGQLELAAQFGAPAGFGKLASTAWTPGRTGVPLLQQCLAWFECQLVDEHPAGDHVLMHTDTAVIESALKIR